MLIKNKLKTALKNFIINKNKKVQTDLDKAIDDLATQIEDIVYEAIKSATVTIPAGRVIVLTANPGAPSSNPAPIILTDSLS